MPMFTRCHVCNAPFPRGTLVEHFPVGRRIAYDPEAGRLWAICEACGGWTLAPFEERWEALDELEALVTRDPGSTGRLSLAGRTDNVALFAAGSDRVLRIGDPSPLEEASWRYGRPIRGRPGRGGPLPFAPRRLRLGEWILGVTHGTRARFQGRHDSSPGSVRRWVRYGTVAWRGDEECGACGHPIRELSYSQCRILILGAPAEGDPTPSLIRACPRCRDEEAGGLHLGGAAAEYVLRRVLAYQQDGGVPFDQIEAAVGLIRGAGGGTTLSSILARYQRYLGELPHISRVALRILANEADERRVLNLEAAALERRWREEEELAAIIDGELSFAEGLEGARLRMREEGASP